MKKMFRKLIGITLVTVFAITSCSQPDNITNVTNVTNIFYKDAEEESVNFITEGLPLYLLSNDVSNVMYVRFYDGDHFVPYVSVRYFLETAANFSIKKTSYSDGKYKYLNQYMGKDFPLVVDVNADTITCPEWAGFKEKTSEYYIEQTAIVDKFLRKIKTFKGQNSQTFDLSAYGFKIYGGIDDAYVPLCILNQLFASCDYRQFVYNGEGIYHHVDDSSFNYNNYTNSSWFINEDGSVKDRPAELIELSYNMLCFTHDYFYGAPGYYGFADNGNGYADQEIVAAADKLKFDDLLKTYDEETRTLLKSTSYFEYVEGFMRLILYTYGDVHASFVPRHYGKLWTLEQVEELNKFLNDVRSIKYKKYMDVGNIIHEKRLAAGKEKKSEDGSKTSPVEIELLPNGKTAVIRFDNFTFDDKAWENYYNQKILTANPNPDPTDEELKNGKVAVPNDTMGLFYRAFYNILNNPDYANVKNVIIDVTCNGGGVVITCQKILCYLTGRGDLVDYDIHTGAMKREYVTGDLNLDGKIDDADKEFYKRLTDVVYINDDGEPQSDGRKLHFAVLTSFLSFSCGNILPNYCAQAGIPIIGERSGGGSCLVGKTCSVDGLPYSYSFNMRTSDYKGANIESGAKITKELTYDQFYDDAVLQSVMDELFVEDALFKD